MTKKECEKCPYEQNGHCLEHECRIAEVNDCPTLRRLQRTKNGVRKEASCSEK